MGDVRIGFEEYGCNKTYEL